jgi:spermidine synthase
VTDHSRVIYRSSPSPGITVADDGYRRSLYLDGDSLQSCMLLNDPAGLAMEYSQAMMCALFFQPEPSRVLLVGLGGGSLVKFLLAACPAAFIEVAEINPEILEVARNFFYLPEEERLRITLAPGEEVIARRRKAGERFDLLLLDAFDDNGPARALLDEQVLRRCRHLLRPHGVFAMNLWNRPRDNFPAIHRTLATVFAGRTLKLALAENDNNAIVFGFAEPVQNNKLLRLKPFASGLARRTGINFVRLLRQLHWQNG